MCCCGGGDYEGAFDTDRGIEGGEECCAAAEQDRNDVQAEFVDESEGECLLHDGGAVEVDVLVAATCLACSMAVATPAVTKV